MERDKFHLLVKYRYEYTYGAYGGYRSLNYLQKWASDSLRPQSQDFPEFSVGPQIKRTNVYNKNEEFKRIENLYETTIWRRSGWILECPLANQRAYEGVHTSRESSFWDPIGPLLGSYRGCGRNRICGLRGSRGTFLKCLIPGPYSNQILVFISVYSAI